MANMNIGSANAGDAFYRYKMPRLEAKIEGRGNGIKTNIVNLVDISKCLGRPPQCTSADQQRKGLGWMPSFPSSALEMRILLLLPYCFSSQMTERGVKSDTYMYVDVAMLDNTDIRTYTRHLVTVCVSPFICVCMCARGDVS